jgi:hypothetical protein
MESSHIGPIILETDWHVTYNKNEKIQDEEYDSIMIYHWFPQLPWDTQLWKISVCIAATRWEKIFNRRPPAQSLYCRSKPRRSIILQGSTIQHCELNFTDCIRWRLNYMCGVPWTEGMCLTSMQRQTESIRVTSQTTDSFIARCVTFADDCSIRRF